MHGVQVAAPAQLSQTFAGTYYVLEAKRLGNQHTAFAHVETSSGLQVLRFQRHGVLLWSFERNAGSAEHDGSIPRASCDARGVSALWRSRRCSCLRAARDWCVALSLLFNMTLQLPTTTRDLAASCIVGSRWLTIEQALCCSIHQCKCGDEDAAVWPALAVKPPCMVCRWRRLLRGGKAFAGTYYVLEANRLGNQHTAFSHLGALSGL